MNEYMHKTLESFKNSTNNTFDEHSEFEEILNEQNKWLDSLTNEEKMGYDAACFIMQIEFHMKNNKHAVYCPYSTDLFQNELVLSELKKMFNVSNIILDGCLYWEITNYLGILSN